MGSVTTVLQTGWKLEPCFNPLQLIVDGLNTCVTPDLDPANSSPASESYLIWSMTQALPLNPYLMWTLHPTSESTLPTSPTSSSSPVSITASTSPTAATSPALMSPILGN